MTRSLVLGSLTLVSYLLACAWLATQQQAIGAPLAWGGVAVLTVPACALCARVMRGAQR